MNRPTRDASNNEPAPRMPEECPRGVEIVSYLYGEATPDERESFAQHLNACDSCRDELDAFGDVREAVIQWRTEALSISSPAFAAAADSSPQASTKHDAHQPQARKPSARAALREFFALSPAWLRIGSVAAALLVCALAALTLTRAEVRWDDDGLAFHTGARERIVEKRVEVPLKINPSEQELETLVNARVRHELEAIRNRPGEAKALNASASSAPSATTPRRAGVFQSETGLRDAPRASNKGRVAATRRQLLANNRLDDRDEENLPRLSDLLDEVH